MCLWICMFACENNQNIHTSGKSIIGNISIGMYVDQYSLAQKSPEIHHGKFTPHQTQPLRFLSQLRMWHTREAFFHHVSFALAALFCSLFGEEEKNASSLKGAHARHSMRCSHRMQISLGARVGAHASKIYAPAESSKKREKTCLLFVGYACALCCAALKEVEH